MAEAEADAEAPYTQLGGADGGDEEALFTALDGAGWAGRSEEPRRAWSGRLLEFWGDGSVRDWQLCALSCFCAPCVWGDNLKRALLLNFLSHTALFFLVRFFGHWVISLVYLPCGQTLIPELHDKSDRTPGTRDFEREERYEECMQDYLAAKYSVFLFTVLLFLYAGWRRIQIRRRFGLPGDDMRDYLSWIFCSPCALCQETRTVHANRIEAGSWLGPAHRPVFVRPPPPQFMFSAHADAPLPDAPIAAEPDAAAILDPDEAVQHHAYNV